MDDSAVVHASNSLRKPKEEAKLKTIAKEICDGMFSGAVSWQNKVKGKNGGWVPHCKMLEVIQGLLDNGAKTTRGMLNKLLKSYVKPAEISVEEAPVGAP
jgi:hypothetical protein